MKHTCERSSGCRAAAAENAKAQQQARNAQVCMHSGAVYAARSTSCAARPCGGARRARVVRVRALRQARQACATRPAARARSAVRSAGGAGARCCATQQQPAARLHSTHNSTHLAKRAQQRLAHGLQRPRGEHRARGCGLIAGGATSGSVRHGDCGGRRPPLHARNDARSACALTHARTQLSLPQRLCAVRRHFFAALASDADVAGKLGARLAAGKN
jgi:hypothetical protein